MNKETLNKWLMAKHPEIWREYQAFKKQKLAEYKKTWFNQTYKRTTPLKKLSTG